MAVPEKQPDPVTAVVVTAGEGPPGWAASLASAARLEVVSPDGTDALEGALPRASAVLVDGALEAPLSVARRVRRLAPELQLVVVASDGTLDHLRRAVRFAPGLSEPWIVGEGEVTPDLLRRAAAIARQRRRHGRRLKSVARQVETLEPSSALGTVLSDEYLATLVELLPEPVLALDEDDRVLFANPSAREALELDGDGGRRVDVREVLDVEDPGTLARLLEASRTGDVRLQMRTRAAEGDPRTYDISAAPVAGERPVRALLLHDVTERVAASERLERQALELERQAEELHARADEMRAQSRVLAERTEANRVLAAERTAVLDHIADGVVIADAEGRITFMNDAAEKIHGTSEAGEPIEAWPQTFDLRTLDGEPYPPAELPLSRALLRHETVTDAEWLIRRPDGSTAHAQGSAAPVVDPEGRNIGAVLTLRDVTLERRRAEERERLLEERDRALEDLHGVLRQRSRFYASMSHELRTPINAIIGYDDLLLGGVFGELPPEQRQPVERASRAANHLLELVNDILDLSKMEAGKLAMEPDDVSIPDLVADLAATMDPLARSHGVELGFEVDAACAPSFRTDPRRLRQVLMNLLSNAIRYGQGSPVTVRCRTPEDALEVDVEDRGPGIAPEKVEAVFDEFVQLQGGESGGTGLGLAIARAITRALGGELRVDSEVGRGSTFTVRLPRME